MMYRVGDRIRHVDTGWVGTVIGVDNSGDWCYLVQYDENEEIKGDDEYYVRAVDIEFIDKRQAFLERLKELLGDFDASIESSAEGSDDSWLDIYFGREHVCPIDMNQGKNYAKLTADTITKLLCTEKK